MARPSRRNQLDGVGGAAPACGEGVVHLDAVREARTVLPGGDALVGLSDLFGALADPTRLRIVAALHRRELCVCDLAVAVGQSESAVSHHLRLLRTRGLVRFRREGRRVYYALDDAHVAAIYGQALDHVDHTGAQAGRGPGSAGGPR